MSDHIPTDLLMEILAQLPVKTLLRFTLVCKFWYSIIRNPDFITIHLNWFSKKNSDDQLLLEYYRKSDDKNYYILIPDGEKLDENHTGLSFPSNISRSFFDVIGSCSGMICLRNGIKHVIIWNPSLRKSVTLALPDKLQKGSWHVLGFGYVSEKSEYKLVRIIYKDYTVPLGVEVYEQGQEHWRVIESLPSMHCGYIFCGYSQVFLHGAVHWLAFDEMGKCQSWIIVFDMRDDVFRDIALPSNLANKHSNELSFTLFKNSLAVLETGVFEYSRRLSLWEMRDYGVFESWTKSHNIILPRNFHSVPLGFRKDSESIFLTDNKALVLYDFEAKTITSKTSFPVRLSFTGITYYTESLVLLKCKNN